MRRYRYQTAHFLDKSERKEKEKLTLIEKVKELTGHDGLITCCGFMSNQYLVSGSNDSSLMLWDLEKPGRFLVKYGDH